MSVSVIAPVLDALANPLVLIGEDERIAHLNPTATDLLGPGLAGLHYITALRQPMLLDAIETALRLHTVGEADYTGRTGNKDTVFTARATPITIDARAMILLAFEDQSALSEARQMRRDFVANVSHELRTPLTALLGFIETLRGPARDDAAARARFLDIMEREAGRMNRLVGDLLSLSRVESEARQRPNAPVNLAELLVQTISRLTPLAEGAGVTIRLEGSDTANPVIPGDHDQLAQVFTNLIENAIKYGKPGGTVYVTLSAHDDEPTLRGAALRVDVADEGEGIADHHIPRLTERFYRIDAHRSREVGGTGLGLAIVKHIVNRHRGRLRIESHTGQGSCFTVVLPR